jgi:integrase
MKTKMTLEQQLDCYLTERRRLGFGLRSAGRLRDFARYVDCRQRSGPVTVELMARWAKDGSTKAEPRAWARRLKLLRPFAQYLRQFDPATEVPEIGGVFGPVPERVTPHIFHEREIVQLLAAARQLMPKPRAATYATLFGLLACTGLRVSEAMHLLDRDVDLAQGLLTIRQTKFAKSRQVALHESAVAALRSYRRARSQWIASTPAAPFFVTTWGRRLGKGFEIHDIDKVFAQIRQDLNWPNRGAHHAPRVHDLRHSFAVRRVLLWHQHGTDIDQAMLALSTYLGHAKISNTYWYLTAVPELMGLAAGKFERFAQEMEVRHG